MSAGRGPNADGKDTIKAHGLGSARNGMPARKPYSYGGGRIVPPSEIVGKLHEEIMRRQRPEAQPEPIPDPAEPVQVERRDLLMSMSPPCWEDACQDCPGVRCACACHDEPMVRAMTTEPEPAQDDGRCPDCRYLRTSPGHQLECEREAS